MSIEHRRTQSGASRYQVRIKHNGRIVAMETFLRKSDAETWEREQYRAIQFGEFIAPKQSSTPFSTVVEEFLDSRVGQVAPHTWRTDRDNLANTPRSWAGLPISTITESDILTHLTSELNTKAYSTVARARTTLSALFQYTVRERMRLRNPVRDVPMPSGAQTKMSKGEVDPPTDDELAEILSLQAQLSEKYAEVTEFISLTGLRWSELRAVRIRGLQEIPFPGLRVSRAHSDGYLEKGTKTKSSRTVPLTARALEIARHHAGMRKPGDYLFVSKMGKQLAGNLFRRYIKWPSTSLGHTIHDLRHHAASSWLRAGIPVHQVAKWLGHKNASTLLRIYAHVLGEKQEIAALKHLDALGAVRAEFALDVADPNLRAALHDNQADENRG